MSEAETKKSAANSKKEKEEVPRPITPIECPKIVDKHMEVIELSKTLKGIAPSEAVFERMIIIVPYKSEQYVKQIE